MMSFGFAVHSLGLMIPKAAMRWVGIMDVGLTSTIAMMFLWEALHQMGKVSTFAMLALDALSFVGMIAGYTFGKVVLFPLLYFVPTVVGPGLFGAQLLVQGVRERRWLGLLALLLAGVAGIVGVSFAAGHPVACHLRNSLLCMDNQVIWYFLSNVAVFAAGWATSLIEVEGERRENWDYMRL